MKLRFSLLICSFLVNTIYSSGQQAERTMLRLPDTGLNTSYTSTYGEDNDYQINTPFFLINGDGTVTDTITGLMWQQNDGGEMTIEQAVTYCDTLTLGGYTDWRLPNAHESFSILNLQFVNPALNPSIFQITNAEYWWTSDKQWNDTTKIWVTNAGGGIGNHQKSETISAGGTKRFHARAVRQPMNTERYASRFLQHPDGTITDQVTGLIWSSLIYSDSLTWENALIYADSNTLGGNTDWRIPNIKELQSLSSVTFGNPSIDRSTFTNMVTGKFWSSTTLPNQTSKAWYLDTQFGITTYQFKTNRLLVLMVRGESAIISQVTSTDDHALNTIYPVPATDNLKIKNEKNVCFNYNIIDSNGNIVSIGKTENNIEITQLPKGLYFLILQEEKPTIYRFIK